MDKIDRSILTILQENARIANVELADRVGLSPSACLRRVGQLEKSGIVKGYHADLSLEKLGHETFDESADLTTLATCPVVVVSAGVKSVLDISATLERLETLSIPVVGYKTSNFPSFWLPTSDYTLDWSVDSADEVAAIVFEQQKLGSQAALLIANPVPDDQSWRSSPAPTPGCKLWLWSAS